MTDMIINLTQNIGTTVRDLRQLRKISVRSLASIINRSPAFVSQMERNLAMPSLKDIYAIAAALHVPVTYFLQDVSNGPEDEKNLIIRKDNRRIIEDDGVITSFLSPRMGDGIEFNQTVFSPLSSTQNRKFNRTGFETGVLIQGCLDMNFSGITHRLNEGDSYCLQLDQFHFSKNPSRTESAIVIWSIKDEG